MTRPLSLAKWPAVRRATAPSPPAPSTLLASPQRASVPAGRSTPPLRTRAPRSLASASLSRPHACASPCAPVLAPLCRLRRPARLRRPRRPGRLPWLRRRRPSGSRLRLAAGRCGELRGATPGRVRRHAGHGRRPGRLVSQTAEPGWRMVCRGAAAAEEERAPWAGFDPHSQPGCGWRTPFAS